MKRILSSLLPALISIAVVSAADYSSLLTKANRFFNQKEWASASAMYDLLLDEHPRLTSIYGRAIVASEARGDSLSSMRLMRNAMDYGIPFDSVFEGVRNESFAIGNAGLYEAFLLQTKDRFSWLSRSIDNTLMSYYSFRENGEKMIEYSTKMLKGLPDNTEFLEILAHGYLLEGDVEKAIKAYRHILTIDSRNYVALLYLGNYYASMAADNPAYRSEAVSYLKKAREIRPTPYVDRLLEQLK